MSSKSSARGASGSPWLRVRVVDATELRERRIVTVESIRTGGLPRTDALPVVSTVVPLSERTPARAGPGGTASQPSGRNVVVAVHDRLARQLIAVAVVRDGLDVDLSGLMRVRTPGAD